MADRASPSRPSVDGHRRIELAAGWTAASCEPDEHPEPGNLDGLDWYAARVPGTAAGVLRDAGLEAADLDAQDWWFRTRFEAGAAAPGEEVVLRLGAIATVADVFLNGELILRSDSMYAPQAFEVGARLAGSNELAIRCRALRPLLAVQRKPRARWRTRLVSDGSLRWFRTMIIGRAPGFAPGPAAVGPWRPVSIERRRTIVVDGLRLRTHLDGDDGIIALTVTVRGLGTVTPTAVQAMVDGPSGRHVATLAVEQSDGARLVARGEVRVRNAQRWWPHTHGDPILHDVRLVVTTSGESIGVDAGRVGFRSLSPGATVEHDVLQDGLDLRINGVRVFARGAVWTPLDPVGLGQDDGELRATLDRVRDAGMNMLRLPGIGAYESAAFHDLCDELGILVWQDFMFANLDYPFVDEAFRRLVDDEVSQVLTDLGGRPSLVVLCGNSEIEQQVAMLGLDPELGRGEFFGEALPAAIRAAAVEAVYVPSAPSGGDLPFRPDRGIANYYGVGAYLRPLADARAAGVRFAAECLAFANVPDDEVLEGLLPGRAAADVVGDPRWKDGVPRDVGADWDFDDVRDHYLGVLFGLDADLLGRRDPRRFLDLSRAVSGEVMAEVFGEWRRAGSASGGGIVLWLRDLVAGAGWGVLDHRGEPKVVYHHVRRALAPTAVWLTDEGLGGIAVHVANDGPATFAGRLRVGLYHDYEHPVGEVVAPLVISPHGAFDGNVESLLGHFVDASWAYRFGPPAQDLVVASLELDTDHGVDVVSQAVRFPAGRPTGVESADRLGLAASAALEGSGAIRLSISSRRFAYGVRLAVPGFRPGDDAFSVEPGREHVVRLRPVVAGDEFGGGGLSALNLAGTVAIGWPPGG